MRWVLVGLLILLPASVSAEPSESHRRAAEELIELMDVESTILGGTEAMADVMISQNPTLGPFRSVIVEWAVRAFTWENFESKFVGIYVEAFSEGEIRDLIAFYRTPTGKKIIRLQPDLMRKGAKLGADVGAENSALLDTMIRARAAELEREGR